MARRKRTKSGRFAKSRKRTTRRKSYRVRSRNPKRTGSYSPKRGQRRLAPQRARRAYTRRRNQKGIFASPAVKYSLAAGVGVGLASWADTSPMLNPTKEDGTALLPMGIKGSVLGGIVTLVLAEYALKGQNKQLARAAAVGMFIPSVISTVQTAMAPNGTTGGAYALARRRRLPFRALPRQSHAAASFASASHSLDNHA